MLEARTGCLATEAPLSGQLQIFSGGMHTSSYCGAGRPFALWLRVEKRGTGVDRSRAARSGRRATDVQPVESLYLETMRELSRLKTVVQALVDAVQALTGSQRNPNNKIDRSPTKEVP